APGFAHSSKVVSPEVHQHYVLGAFFFIGKQVRLQPGIFLLGGPSRTRSGDRIDLGGAPLYAYEDFRRRADNGEILQFQEIEVGGWVDDPERAVDVKKVPFVPGGKALGENDLENIPLTDIFFRPLNHRAIVSRGQLGRDTAAACRGRRPDHEV